MAVVETFHLAITWLSFRTSLVLKHVKLLFKGKKRTWTKVTWKSSTVRWLSLNHSYSPTSVRLERIPFTAQSWMPSQASGNAQEDGETTEDCSGPWELRLSTCSTPHSEDSVPLNCIRQRADPHPVHWANLLDAGMAVRLPSDRKPDANSARHVRLWTLGGGSHLEWNHGNLRRQMVCYRHCFLKFSKKEKQMKCMWWFSHVP